MKDRKVVVLTSLKLLQRKDQKMWAARLPNLGLTAYGRTSTEATEAVKQLFNSFIAKYREMGVLEKRLKQIGVTWYWQDEYPNDGLPVEDTSGWVDSASTFAIAA